MLARHILRTRTVSQVMSLSSHPHVRAHESVLLALLSPSTSTMTLHSRVCFAKLTEYIAITLYGSTCLSVCRRGACGPSDYVTPLTGYEPKKDLNLVNTEELDLAATSDVYWQHTLDDDASLNDPNVDDNQLAKYLAVVVDGTGKPVEMRSNNDQFSCDTRNLKSAQNQFPVVAQPEMICQTGGSVQARIAEERENAHAQIRTMLG